MKKVAIYGAGGSGREVAWLLSTPCRNRECELVGFVEDGPQTEKKVNGFPVFSLEELTVLHPDAVLSVAVGNPGLRQKLVERVLDAKLGFTTLIHHSVEISEFNRIGIGSLICCGSVLTVNIELGQHVHVNVDCTISHDVKIGDFTTLSPGVHVSGNVHIGRHVFIGAGAVLINGTTDDPLIIGDGCVIGAGASVTSSAEANALYAGVPAVHKKHFQ